MKKIICAILACSIGAVSAAALNGCGCNGSGSNGSQESKQGYQVVATQPDLKDDTFGFYILNDKEVMLTRYFGSLTDVVIPDIYQNYTVTTIGHSVFNNDGIKTITVPETVTDIQDYEQQGSDHRKAALKAQAPRHRRVLLLLRSRVDRPSLIHREDRALRVLRLGP